MAKKFNYITNRYEDDNLTSNINNPTEQSQQTISSWDNYMDIVGNTAKSLITPIKNPSGFNMSTRRESMQLIKPQSLTTSIPKLDMDAITNKGISTLNSSIAKDSAPAMAKAAGTANFASTMGVASQLVDPILGMGEQVASSLGTNFAEKDLQSTTTDAISSVAGMFGPAGQAVGIGLKLFDTADRAFGKNVSSFNGDTGTSSYNDFSTQGKQYRFTAGNQANQAEITKKQNQQFYTTAIGNVNQQKKVNNASTSFGNQLQNKNQNALNGFDSSKILLSKNGSKLELLKEKVKSKKNNDEVKLVQHGSVVDGQETLGREGMAINIIPDGALHAHKHHMEDINDEMTKKGIPVISIAKKGDILDYEEDNKTPKTIAEGGEVIQHAEIEKEEVILHLGLTKQLEKLMKDNTIESTIEAGRLLAKELMENTQDNTDLTEKLIENED